MLRCLPDVQSSEAIAEGFVILFAASFRDRVSVSGFMMDYSFWRHRSETRFRFLASYWNVGGYIWLADGVF